jgi:hypothetical protein
MMLAIEPITNISLAALHARRKEIRARIWKPSPRPPAIARFKPRAINCIPYASLPSLTQQPDQPLPDQSDASRCLASAGPSTAANHSQYRCGSCGIPYYHRRPYPIAQPKAPIR